MKKPVDPHAYLADLDLRAEETYAHAHDRSGNIAIGLTALSGIATEIAWCGLFLPPGPTRFDPLLAAFVVAYVWWLVPVARYERRALARLRLFVAAWPTAAAVALGVRLSGGGTHDGLTGMPSVTPAFSVAWFAASAVLALGAFAFVHRSALPGGTKPLAPQPVPRAQPKSALMDYSQIRTVDADGYAHEITKDEAYRAQPKWLLWFSGSIACWMILETIMFMTCSLAFPQTMGWGVLVSIAGIVAYFLAFRFVIAPFGKAPNPATRGAIERFMFAAATLFIAFALVGIMLVAPHDPFAPAFDSALFATVALASLVVLAIARHGLLRLDLVRLARDGYRAGDDRR